MEGLIFSIVRTSLHDGPGIRTVIYFKGCSLHCAWCHNPEGISHKTDILSYADRCIGCNRCIDVCPEHIRGGYRLSVCRHCGQCADACPNEALTVCGTWYTAEKLMGIIRKDKLYYNRTGGGVTFSGGECLLQSEFVTELAKLCHAENIHTACETALHVSSECLHSAAVHMDLIYADLKHMNPIEHKHWTGADNRLILENLKWLSHNHPDVIVRIPLIPGVNDGEDNLIESVSFINECGSGIKGVELLRYNEMASSKYAPIGMDSEQFSGFIPQSDEEMQNKRDLMRAHLPSRIKII